MKCSACNIEMESLVPGIFQCPRCKKIQKQKDDKKEKEAETHIEQGEFLDGDYFHKNASLNKQYEICEKGVIIDKTETRLFAALICHSAYLKDEKYIRLSWWKTYQHAGMFKIYDKDVLNNVITSLEKINDSFDDVWKWIGKYGKQEPKTEEILEKEKYLELLRSRIIENRTCPKCQKKMNKEKSHYECQHCGEIVILEGYNQPIFNIPSKELDLSFQANFPINYYMPVSGITVKWLMGEWKAIVIIHSKDNPNKKWLRFYWWMRDLSNILKFGQREIGEGTQMGWKAQKGIASPNMYDKKLVIPLIKALKKIQADLDW
ncbi:MAG: hypothetical protein EAX91_05035 [Candidatus Lokiarchaeota archaeon]|nr:hypothetical protein [Candidatus Lokiarchaeota archaeon]